MEFLGAYICAVELFFAFIGLGLLGFKGAFGRFILFNLNAFGADNIVPVFLSSVAVNRVIRGIAYFYLFSVVFVCFLITPRKGQNKNQKYRQNLANIHFITNKNYIKVKYFWQYFFNFFVYLVENGF